MFGTPSSSRVRRMNFVSTLRQTARDARDLGPTVLQHLVGRPDAAGYSRVPTRYGSFYVRRSETDMNVLRQVFGNREYDLNRFPQGRRVQARYQAALDQGRTPLIIDGGANVGFSACFFARSYPKARILAVEPHGANAALCRVNTRDAPGVEVIEAALGAEKGHVAIEHHAGHAWAVRTHRAETGLDVVTINDLVASVPGAELLIVKIDIEGFELDLFSANTEWIAQAYVVFAEPHDWMLPGKGTSRTLQRAMSDGEREILVSGDNLIWVRRDDA